MNWLAALNGSERTLTIKFKEFQLTLLVLVSLTVGVEVT